MASRDKMFNVNYRCAFADAPVTKVDIAAPAFSAISHKSSNIQITENGTKRAADRAALCLMEEAMKPERVRERISGTPDNEYFSVREKAGWKLIAVEWERLADDQPTGTEEVPYGMRVATDCQHLEYDPHEMAVLTLMMELIVQEHTFSQIAQELNKQGCHRRDGQAWTEISAFNLLPRLIEVGPRMFSTAEWVERRKRIYALLGK